MSSMRSTLKKTRVKRKKAKNSKYKQEKNLIFEV